jgi:hypothetical protein
MGILMLLMHAARRTSRPPTPARELRASRGPRASPLIELESLSLRSRPFSNKRGVVQTC